MLFREAFQNVDNWKPVFFPKVERHTSYSVHLDKEKRFLKAESNGSASGLIWKQTFNVYEYPKARWSWKVDNIYPAAVRPALKSNDDYPIRIYLLFEYRHGLATKVTMRHGSTLLALEAALLREAQGGCLACVA